MAAQFQKVHQVDVLHAWGMTELSPLGTVCNLKPHQLGLPEDARYAIQAKQGRSVFGIDMKIVDANGKSLSWDGEAVGDLLVRGPWVASAYFGDSSSQPLRDGWFPTGDMAKIDRDGFMQITDRSKDVIKSGGEWISSIDIENIACLHPCVASATCIGVRHPKWDERPLLLITRTSGSTLEKDELLAFLDGKLARWWKPDDVLFLDSFPLGATGKVLKAKLREQYGDHYASLGGPKQA
jgi:fatty-acyl-CoA synthase